MKQVHVTPSPKGGWNVKLNNAERASSHHDTKAEAEKAGRAKSRKIDAELVIHNKDGRIARKDSHGNDPFPPRG